MSERIASIKKTIALLEFDKVIAAAASCALSAEAARIISGEIPFVNDSAAGTALEQKRKEIVKEIYALLKADLLPAEELPAVSPVVSRLMVEGAALEADEALALGLFIERGVRLRGALVKNAAEGSALLQTAESVNDCSAQGALIFSVIDHEGRVKDTPALKKIRDRIQTLKTELEHIAARYHGSEETRRMLQSQLPTQRDGRLVLALKANFRGRIKGIVHEVSATGQTVFVEPEESVETNNQLRIEEGGLSAELRKILRELTASLGGHHAALELFTGGIVHLETLRARAVYSLENGYVFAQDGEVMELREARHPLLGTAVPIDFSMRRMDEEIRVVIITGPNTGGKTVALKTAGLFALMNHAGLAVPAAEGTVVPFFGAVYADIGDEQSIAQNLSTFSAHLQNTGNIINEAGKNSLVLLDELGAGTDPEEGSAIALAILDQLLEKQSRVLVTTHHGILKNYGYSRPGVENASVEFDPNTLSPTYRIIMGIPGESRALDIALRNGLSEALVAKARGYLDKERFDISALISGLKEKHRDAELRQRTAKETEFRLREEKRQSDLRDLRLRQKELILKREGAGEFRRFLEESRKKLENLVREIREGEMNREKTLAVKEFLHNLEADALDMENKLDKEEALLTKGDNAGFSAEISAGSEVLAGTRRQRGRALRQEKNGEWIVELGSVRMSFAAADLIPAPPSPPPAVSVSAEITPVTARGELSLIGMHVEDALEALDRQIEAALLSGLREFAVIHGKGDGVLQRAVHEFLKNCSPVADYYFSRPELGGFGRTEVILAG
ncbi:MAG: endonuclease MutS2 [Treponema sp.]|jgi:DNA mismatch repair protein MutS2|nr:endonuclease MutS2 [Treponema sp.]